MADKEAKCHANFVRTFKAPRSPLILSTPTAISGTLFRLYPFLLILDNILDNVLWIAADPGTTFIKLILVLLSTRYLLTSQLSDTDNIRSTSIETYILDFAGVFSTGFLSLSIIYYVTTLSNDLKTQNPPTLDDILQVAEDISVKLGVLREESLALCKVESLGALVRCCLLTTPIQILLFRYKLVSSPRGYVLSVVLLLGCYHAVWFQGTLRLLHRIRPVRGMWYIISRYLLSGTVLPRITPLTSLILQHMLSKIKTNDYWILTIPATEDLHEYINDIQHLKQLLLTLIDSVAKVGEYTPGNEVKTVKGLKFRALEIEICENERKWNHNRWCQKLLAYERYPFTASPLEDPVAHPSTISSENLPKNWFWLDNEWTKTDWIYCDTSWVPIGVFDSPECFTRFRVWKRKVFQKVPPKKDAGNTL